MAPTEPFTVRVTDWEEFSARRDEYEALLRRSAADPLFQGYEWLSAWWDIHREQFRLRIEAHLAESPAGNLVGIALITKRRFRHRMGLSGVRIEPIGNLWREPGAVLTEYVSFPADRQREDEITRALWNSVLGASRWTDICVSYCPVESETWRMLQEIAACAPNLYVRGTEETLGYRVSLTDGFEKFLSRLGPSTRNRVFNSRERLAKHGAIRFVNYQQNRLQHGLAVLDRLHMERWCRPALTGLRGEMYRRIAEERAPDGVVVASLELEDRPIAASLDIRHSACQYNIQLAISQEVPKRISSGFLHLGYLIEQAASNRVQDYDLLAGLGKRTDYKKKFRGVEIRFGSTQVLHGGPVALAYRLHDSLQLR